MCLLETRREIVAFESLVVCDPRLSFFSETTSFSVLHSCSFCGVIQS